MVGRGGGDIKADKYSAHVPILKEVEPFGNMAEVPTKTPGLPTKDWLHRSTRKLKREKLLPLRHQGAVNTEGARRHQRRTNPEL